MLKKDKNVYNRRKQLNNTVKPLINFNLRKSELDLFYKGQTSLDLLKKGDGYTQDYIVKNIFKKGYTNETNNYSKVLVKTLKSVKRDSKGNFKISNLVNTFKNIYNKDFKKGTGDTFSINLKNVLTPSKGSLDFLKYQGITNFSLSTLKKIISTGKLPKRKLYYGSILLDKRISNRIYKFFEIQNELNQLGSNVVFKNDKVIVSASNRYFNENTLNSLLDDNIYKNIVHFQKKLKTKRFREVIKNAQHIPINLNMDHEFFKGIFKHVGLKNKGITNRDELISHLTEKGEAREFSETIQTSTGVYLKYRATTSPTSLLKGGYTIIIDEFSFNRNGFEQNFPSISSLISIRNHLEKNYVNQVYINSDDNWGNRVVDDLDIFIKGLLNGRGYFNPDDYISDSWGNVYNRDININNIGIPKETLKILVNNLKNKEFEILLLDEFNKLKNDHKTYYVYELLTNNTLKGETSMVKDFINTMTTILSWGGENKYE